MTQATSTVRSSRSFRGAQRAAFLMMAVAPVAAMLSMPAAQASNWSGGGANGNWTNILNWDSVPGSASPILFTGTINTATIDDIASGTAFGGITFDASAGNFSIASNGGNTLTPGGDIIDNSVTSTQTFNIGVLLNGNRNFNTGAGGTMIFNAISATGNFGVSIGNLGPATTTAIGTAGGAAPGGVSTGTPGGVVVFNAPVSYTGVTNLNGGNLTLAVDNNLAGGITFGATPSANYTTTTVGTNPNSGNITAITSASASGNVSTLNVNGNVTTSSLIIQTVNTVANSQSIIIAPGKSLTVNGAFTLGPNENYTQPYGGVTSAIKITGDTFVINGTTTNMIVGVGRGNIGASGTDPVGTMNMTGLGNFTYAGTTGQLIIGGGNGVGNMTLATNNTITAAQIHIGDTQVNGSQDNSGGSSLMTLGSGNNTINTNLLLVGNDKAGGNINFGANVTGTLVLNGEAGATSTVDITLATYINGAQTQPTNLNFGNHTVTVNAGNVSIGTISGTGTATGTNATGTITFDTGTFTANKILMGSWSTSCTAVGALANNPTGIFTLGTASTSTGILTVGSISLGNRTLTTTGAGAVTATFNVQGGTANVNGDILDASTTFATGNVNKTTLNMTGGTLNVGAHNIGTYAVPINVINLTGGTTNASGNIAGRTIALNPTVLTGHPTLILSDAGNMTLSGGNLILSTSGGLQGGSSANAGNITGGDVTLNAGTTLAPGSASVTGTLNVTGNVALNGANAVFKFGPSSNDILNVTGALTLSGSIPLTITPLGTGPAAGNFTIMTYTGGLTGNETNFSLGTNTTRFTYSVVPTALSPANTIQVSVGGTGPLSLTYLGVGTSNWDLKTTSDFKGPSTPSEQFFSLDSVTFDDNSTNAADVQTIGTLNAGNFTINATRSYTFSGAGNVTAGVFLKDNTGSAVLNNTNSFVTSTINNGTLAVAGDTNLGNATINGSGTLQIGNGGATGNVTSTVPITNNGNVIFNRTGNYIFTAGIAGSGVVAYNAGNVTLNNTNSYAGTTTINAGADVIAVNSTAMGNVGSNAAVTINAGGTLDLGGDPTINNVNFGAKVFTIAGTGVGGVGAVTNTGIQQFAAFGNITLAGNTTFSGKRFDIGRITGADQLNLNGNTLTLNMDAPSASLFAILGNVTVTPGNIVVNSGGTSIEGNATVLADASSSITYNPGSFSFYFATNGGNVTRQMIFKGNNVIGSGCTTASAVASPISLQGNVILEPMTNGVPDTVDNFPMQFNGNVTESGGSFGISKLGVNTFVIAGAVNTWSGASTLNSGTLRFSLNPTTTTNVSTIGSFTGTGGGAMLIDTGVQVTSGGLQTNGALTVNGKLQVANAVTRNLSKVSTLTVAGTTGAWTGAVDLTNSRLAVEDTSGTRAADIAMYKDMVANNVGGTVGIFSSTAAANGQVVVVSDNAVRLSSFGSAGSNFGTGIANVDASSILITTAVLGDANLDGVVDIKDLQDLANHWQQPATDWSQADFDGNGVVALQDLQALANHWQNGVGAPGQGSGESFSEALSLVGQFGGSSSVPEPMSLAILGLGGVVLASRRRRNGR